MRPLFVILVAVLISIATPATNAAQPPTPTSRDEAAAPNFGTKEPLITAIIVNGERRGEIFMIAGEDGDYLVKRTDLIAFGIQKPEGRSVDIDGETHLWLRSVPQLSFEFDEASLELKLQISAAALGTTTIDLASKRPSDVITPKQSNGFWNYRLAYSDTPFENEVLLNSEFGFRRGKYFFFTDSFHRLTGSERGDVRLTSSVSRDWRDRLTRLTLGDFVGASGDLGGALNLGGMSYSKVWDIDPYVVRQPRYFFNGTIANAAEAQVLIDGVPMYTRDLPAGAFELRNLEYYGGARNVTVVVKDKFGRTQQYVNPYYFTEDLLREGLHDFAYHVGAVREDFGTRSNKYAKGAFLGFHRYAPRDGLNLGVRWEVSKDLTNLGPQASFQIGNRGIGTIGLALGHYDDVASVQHHASLSYSYQDRAWNASALARFFSDRFRFLGQAENALQPHHELFAALGWGNPVIGNLTLSAEHIDRQQAADRRAFSVGYSRGLWRGTSAFITLSRVDEGRSGAEVFAGFSYNPSADYNVTALHQRRLNSGTSSQLVAGKNVPFGEGLGYRVALEQTDFRSEQSSSVSPFVQYNARYATFTAEYQARRFSNAETAKRYEVAVAGGIGFVGSYWGISRPIEDAFGVVRLADIGGVRVYQNSQEVGRTNGKGLLFLPNLGSYIDNQISVSDKDVPINYSISTLTRYISPGQRSGGVIEFSAQRIQALSGKLFMRTEGGKRAMEHVEVTLDNGATLPTAKDGEFYAENMAPGRYRGMARYAGKQCNFVIEIPKSEEVIVDVGEVLCVP